MLGAMALTLGSIIRYFLAEGIMIEILAHDGLVCKNLEYGLNYDFLRTLNATCKNQYHVHDQNDGRLR
jgi:hypothetical protein